MFYEFSDLERKDEIKQAFLASHITCPGVMLLLVARYSFAPTAQILIAGFYLAALHDSPQHSTATWVPVPRLPRVIDMTNTFDFCPPVSCKEW